MDLRKVDQILNGYDRRESWLVMIFQDIQEAYNYLPAAAIRHVAEQLGISLSRAFNVATFYSSFSLAERGRHVVRVCDGTACHLRGSTNLLDEITRHLGIGPGQTTPDKAFTLEVVACLGACALAPVMAVGADYHGQMTPEKVRLTLERYRNLPAPAAAGGDQAAAGA